MSLLPAVIVPSAALVWLLTTAMQYAKPLLEQYLPPFEPSDPNHNRNLRIAFGAAAFACILAYALVSMPHPASLDGWFALLAGVVVTAQGITGVGHLTYKAFGPSSPYSADPGAPPDFPPGAPSIAALGLPEAPEPLANVA